MLEARGFACEVVRQGALTLNAPMKAIRERLLDGDIVSNSNPLLQWYIGNVRLRRETGDVDRDNWVPTKRNRYRKIDGFAALLDAYTVYMRLNTVLDAGYDEPHIGVISIY